MIQKVNVPGVGVIGFPDSMSHQDIIAAVQKNYPDIPNKSDKSGSAVGKYRPGPIEMREYFTPEARAARRAAEQDELVSGMKGENIIANKLGTKNPIVSGALNALLPITDQAMMSGIGHAYHNVGLAGEQMLGLASHADASRDKQDAEALMRSGAGKVGDFTGYSVMSLPLAVLSPATLLGRAGLGSGVSGLAGLLTPYENSNEHINNTLTGLGVGAALPVLGTAAGSAIKNSLLGLASPEARALMAEGVKLTPGQMAGGVAKAAEDAATSIPVLGSAIQKARNQSLETFNLASVNRALKSIGQAVPKTAQAGRDALSYANKAIGDAYDATLQKMSGRLDSGIAQDIASLWNKYGGQLPKDKFSQLENTIQHEVVDRFDQSGNATGDAIKKAYSKLGQMASGFKRSGNYDDRTLGAAVKELQGSMRDMLTRNNPQHLNEALDAADDAFKQMVRVNRAARYVGAKDGVFTPSQLNSAVAATDSSRNKAAYVAGNAVMQDLADLGRKVLPSNIADSGTASRLLHASPQGLAAAAATIPLNAIYSSLGMRTAKALLAPQQGPVRNFLAELTKAQLASPRNALLAFSAMGNQPQAPNPDVPK